MKIELHSKLYNNTAIRNALKKEFKKVDFVASKDDRMPICSTEHTRSCIAYMNAIIYFINKNYPNVLDT